MRRHPSLKYRRCCGEGGELKQPKCNTPLQNFLLKILLPLSRGEKYKQPPFPLQADLYQGNLVLQDCFVTRNDALLFVFIADCKLLAADCYTTTLIIRPFTNTNFLSGAPLVHLSTASKPSICACASSAVTSKPSLTCARTLPLIDTG